MKYRQGRFRLEILITGKMAGLMWFTWLLSILFALVASEATTTEAPTSTSTFTPSPSAMTATIASTSSDSITSSPSVSIASTRQSDATTPNGISTTSKHLKESSPTASTTERLTMTPNSGSSTLTETSRGLNDTTMDIPLESKTSLHPTSFSSLIPNSSVTSAHVTTSSNADNSLARNPGLVAVISIFFIALALLLAVAIAKAISSRKPQFEKLEDLPMNKMNEESPFAHYPPK
ncbi:hypothetical protein AAFF_G00257730 [Aldrovandia affinis]|uniref:Uncharacterized protein n=1 Tax=Aldrovandia affinis TaxID=143900 RepID=A0AAD7WU42_9TELE|nr:hypothetical protein AAFF_G00257730 [Aldrovandia affinis]